MSEYESIQRGPGDAMASQSADNPRTHETLSGVSGPHYGADPRVLARMPDLNASEPEVSNTPSRRHRRSPDGLRPGSGPSLKVILLGMAAVAAVIAVVFVLTRPGDSDSERASDLETWDSDFPDGTSPEAPLWTETAETGSQYPSTGDPTADPFPAADPSRNAALDPRNPPNWGQAQDQVYDPTPSVPWPNQPDTVAHQTAPPTQYNGSQVGDYGLPSAAPSDWSNQAAGTAIQRPSAAPAVPEPYYGSQSAAGQTPYQHQYEAAGPPAPYQDSTIYADPYQRTQSNSYVRPRDVPSTRSHAPSAAVTIAPPATSLRDRLPIQAPVRTDSGVYGTGVPAVAQRPDYRSGVRPPSTSPTPYRAETSLPPTYRTPTTQQSGYPPSYGQGAPQTNYPGQNPASDAGSLAPRYGDAATYPYSQPGQPGVATLNGVIERQPPARASYDSSRPSLY